MSKQKKKSRKPHHADHQDMIPKRSMPSWFYWIPFVFALILYGNTIPNEFTLDDLPQIVNNKFVQEGFEGIPKLIATNYWSGSGQNLGYYRPLSHITFALEKVLYNNNPHLMHLVNVLLYALTGMLLMAFLAAIFKNMHFFILAVTILFLAHPVHTEVVASIKSRDEMLSFINSILALWLIFRYSKSKSMWSLVCSWIFYFLALMSKETAMTTLALIPFMLYFFTPKKGNYIAWITISFIVVSGLFLLLKFSFLGTLSGSPPNEMNVYPYKDLAGRIPTTLFIFGMYLYRLIFPVRLLYDYSYNQIPEAGWLNPVVILSLIVAVGIVVFAIKNLKRKNIPSFAIVFFGVTLSVGLSFVVLRGGIMAERFLYAPVFGFSLALCYYLFKLLPHDKRTKQFKYDFKTGRSKTFILILSVLILFYSVRTIARNPVWKNNYTLFSTDIKWGSNSALLLKHYGSELINLSVESKDKVEKDSLMDAGMAELLKALEINPRFSEANFKMGYAYYQLREFEKSIEFYKRANQGNSMTVSNMALSYYMIGDHGEALRLLKRALQLDPTNGTARQNLPMVQNAFNRKLQTMQKEVSNDPEHYYDLGNLQVEHEKFKEAIESYDNAIRLDSQYIGAIINKGNCYYMLKNYQNAIRTFEEVLRLDPNNQMARKNLGHLYGLLGDTEKQLYYEKKTSPSN